MTRISPPRVGRPPSREKYEAILDTAKRLLITKGFSDTSIEGIAESAEVSKVTVYKWFGNKNAVYEAVVRREADAMLDQIRTYRETAEEHDLAEALEHFGMTLLGYLTREDSIKFDNMIATECVRSPELTRHFFLAGPKPMHDELKAILSSNAARTQLAIADIDQAAGDLIGLWRGFDEIEERFGWKSPPNSAQVEARVSRGVKIFLKIYQSGVG
ncbi:TetR/AcrR family transcriptional regulator [Parasphingopyxis algicola]|uniref:TetR/AcrR family transcriptional regulator n=1 Tax=Parasphingopyxis algicola TaxID=2026624 RepID=UPI0015A1AE81|nr:TetR/AcrR family transcriptional regulator [Parasphingopyxis algicola]QLC26432.1 TetR/AcrR family transcriptional regulator [Parasphingopyxis algicola]